MARNRRGSIGIILFIILLVLVSLSSIFVFTKYRFVGIERRNIHDKIIASNLALYKVIEQGNKADVLVFQPDKLTNYIKNPSLVQSSDKNKVFNLMTSEYFPVGERYKGLYLEKGKALQEFKNYLAYNCNLTESTPGSNIFIPTDANSNFITKLTVKEFFIHNAVPNWDQDISNPNNDIISNKYTGVHVYIEVEVKNNIKFFNFEEKIIKIPVHVDTDLTVYRSKQ